MKIQKLKEEVVFIKETIEHKFLINGKETKIYEHKTCSSELPLENDFSIDIDEEDSKKLEEEEIEFIDENFNEILGLKVNEELKEE